MTYAYSFASIICIYWYSHTENLFVPYILDASGFVTSVCPARSPSLNYLRRPSEDVSYHGSFYF